MKYSVDDILFQFNNKIRLSEFLRKYLELTPRGDSFIAKCPFHNEKTPSFTINDQKGLFYCFGCGVGGNVFNFITKYEKVSFRDSLLVVANQLGIKIGSEINKKQNNFEKQFGFLKVCNDFFKECLLENEQAKNYLYSRSIDDEIIKKFEIGFCPADSNKLINYIENKGFENSDIYKQGLFIKSKKSERPFGRFSNRIVFPIFNFSNKIIGFGGRTISDSKIKYINSAENELFKKSQNLYGLKQNIANIKLHKELILVEGYFDVISLNANNIDTTVASLGTTLSEIQIKKIWNIVDIPIICFDGDFAGLKAMKNIAVKLIKYLKPGKSIKFIILPNRLDPDSYLSQFGKESFMSLKKESKDLSDLIWEIIIENKNFKTPEFIALIDQKINEISNSIENKLVSNEYFKFLKAKKNDFVWSSRKFNEKVKSKVKGNLIQENQLKLVNEKILLSYLIFENEISADYVEEISCIEFSNAQLNNMKSEIVSRKFAIINYKEDKSIQDFMQLNKNNYFEEFKKIRNNHFKNLSIKEKKMFLEDIILNLKLPKLLEEREQIKKKINQSENSDEMNKFIKMHENITNEINIIKKRDF